MYERPTTGAEIIAWLDSMPVGMLVLDRFKQKYRKMKDCTWFTIDHAFDMPIRVHRSAAEMSQVEKAHPFEIGEAIYEAVPGGRLPVRAEEGSVGMDCFLRLSEPKQLGVHREMLRLGFKIAIPRGWCADIRERSSAHKNSVYVHLGTIDASYRGEVRAIMSAPWAHADGANGTGVVSDGDRYAQLVLRVDTRIPIHEGVVPMDTDRGDGGFGHTGLR